MRLRPAAAIGAAALLLAAACGGDDSGSDDTEPEDSSGNGAGGVVAVGQETELGEILVDANGMTLYAFTNDEDGKSECYDTCAETWPPLLVGSDWDVGGGLDRAIFNAHERNDGTQQLVIGKWPLYLFAEDVVPGDMKGQGSGGVWFVVATDGTIVEDEPAGDGDGSDIQVGSTDLGEVLVDSDGLTLYGFTNDEDGLPTCAGDCADQWPPLLVEGEPTLAEGLDPEIFTTVEGAEGGTHVVAGKWPLYRFAGDASPGDVRGQGTGDVWFAVAPDGTLIGVDGGADPAPPAGNGGNGGGDY